MQSRQVRNELRIRLAVHIAEKSEAGFVKAVERDHGVALSQDALADRGGPLSNHEQADAVFSTLKCDLRDLADQPTRIVVAQADVAIDDVRLIGHAVVASFFGKEKPRDRDNLRVANAGVIELWLKEQAPRSDVEELAALLSEDEHPVTPFHWELEFPEVFLRENGGFDAFVGNPPFAGKNTIAAGQHSEYLPWLLTIHEESHGNADLVAHFFRRAFNLVRQGGSFGLIATNTIAQGDTRSTGLRWICTHGGTIYGARKRFRWPGRAAVVVSVIHVRRGNMAGSFLLDGRQVPTITAFLFPRGGHEDPYVLVANQGIAFKGVSPNGRGFVFDDSGFVPVRTMKALLEKNPHNADRIRLYVGGEEILDPPGPPHRWIIDLDGLSEAEAREWPDLWNLLSDTVRLERASKSEAVAAMPWWHFERSRPKLKAALQNLKQTIVTPHTAGHLCFVFQPTDRIFSQTVIVIVSSGFDTFGVLQSRVHELWARTFASSFKDDPRYPPSDAFESFPFPEIMGGAIAEAGEQLCTFRDQLVARTGEGLTEIYNRFHDPAEVDPAVQTLREMHEAMDRQVLPTVGPTSRQHAISSLNTKTGPWMATMCPRKRSAIAIDGPTKSARKSASDCLS